MTAKQTIDVEGATMQQHFYIPTSTVHTSTVNIAASTYEKEISVVTYAVLLLYQRGEICVSEEQAMT